MPPPKSSNKNVRTRKRSIFQKSFEYGVKKPDLTCRRLSTTSSNPNLTTLDKTSRKIQSRKREKKTRPETSSKKMFSSPSRTQSETCPCIGSHPERSFQ